MTGALMRLDPPPAESRLRAQDHAAQARALKALRAGVGKELDRLTEAAREAAERVRRLSDELAEARIATCRAEAARHEARHRFELEEAALAARCRTLADPVIERTIAAWELRRAQLRAGVREERRTISIEGVARVALYSNREAVERKATAIGKAIVAARALPEAGPKLDAGEALRQLERDFDAIETPLRFERFLPAT